MTDISLAEARSIALRAQGFGGETVAPIELLDRLGAIQLDSVNVLARPQDLVAFARIGPHSVAEMHRDVYLNKGGFEYWGHAACWLPMAEYRYFLPRMAERRAAPNWRDTLAREEHSSLYPLIRDRIREEGPLGAAAFEDPREHRGTWWDRKPAKLVLEDLFDQGELMVSGRTSGFDRLYDLTERVLPADLDVSDPGPAAAYRHLMKRAITALGIASVAEAADYFRLAPAAWRPALKELLEADEVVPIGVEDWKQPAFCVPSVLKGPPAPLTHAPTFLSPFDNLVWNRDRVQRLFGFHYRIEIYVPEPKRTYGYYVLPLLARGQLLGRADLKLDREAGVMRVKGLWLEGATIDEADAALSDLAAHLGATSFEVERVVRP